MRQAETKCHIDPCMFDSIFKHLNDELAVKRAYRDASLKLHPDVCREFWAAEMFIALGMAKDEKLASLQVKTRNENNSTRDGDPYKEQRQKWYEREQRAREFNQRVPRAKKHAQYKAASKAAREIEASLGWGFGDIRLDDDGTLVVYIASKREWRVWERAQWRVCDAPVWEPDMAEF